LPKNEAPGQRRNSVRMFVAAVRAEDRRIRILNLPAVLSR